MRGTANASTAERKAIPLRLPPELHQDLRMLALFTGQSVNEIVTGLISDFMAANGRELIERGMTARAQAGYREALDKLAE
jgi:predicted DNA-binding protein